MHTIRGSGMISQSDLLRAVQLRAPDSFAPNGDPLLFVPVADSRFVAPEWWVLQTPSKQIALLMAEDRKQREA